MIDPGAVIEASADIDAQVSIGSGTRVWHLAQVRAGANIGSDCVIGRAAYIGAGVRIGNCSKVQNSALVYEPAELGFGVFVGPGAILTNDHYPRAVTVDLEVKGATDWQPEGVVIGDGAAIGAGAVCIAPIKIGKWAMVAAGAVVTRDVRDFELVGGNPAKHLAWIGRAGRKLEERDGAYFCPVTHRRYQLERDVMAEVE